VWPGYLVQYPTLLLFIPRKIKTNHADADTDTRRDPAPVTPVPPGSPTNTHTPNASSAPPRRASPRVLRVDATTMHSVQRLRLFLRKHVPGLDVAVDEDIIRWEDEEDARRKADEREEARRRQAEADEAARVRRAEERTKAEEEEARVQERKLAQRVAKAQMERNKPPMEDMMWDL
jgi:hypothetical protein